MIEQENYISVFKERKTPEGRVRDPIGDFPVQSGTYDIPNGGKISLDLSKISQSMRGPRLVRVKIGDAHRFQEISLGRTGRGYQGIAKDLRLGVEVYNPRGVTRS